MTMQAENLDRLPKWAKQRILTLEANLEYSKQQVAQIGEKEETNIYIQQGLEKKTYLPKNSNVYFIVNGLPMSITFRGEKLELKGYEELKILPRAVNSIQISQENYAKGK